MQSTRSLGFWAASARCWLIFTLLCIRNPRSFLASLLTDCAVIGLFHPRYRANLLLLDFLRFLSDQFSTCFSSLTLQHVGCSLQQDLSFFKDKALCGQLLCTDYNATSSPFWPLFPGELVSVHFSLQACNLYLSNFHEIITRQLCRFLILSGFIPCYVYPL